MAVKAYSTDDLIRAAWLFIKRGETDSALAVVDEIDAKEWNREDVRTVARVAIMLAPTAATWED